MHETSSILLSPNANDGPTRCAVPLPNEVQHPSDKQPGQWARVGVSLVRHDAEGYLPRSPHKSCLGSLPKANAAETSGGIPTEPLPQLGLRVGLCCRPPLTTMETSSMLLMEPVAAAALVRALLWQFSRVFITPDSQHGTSLSDST